MSIELPPENLRNLLVIDYLLDRCSLEAIIKYFKLADPVITKLIQCNTRFCNLLVKYLRTLEQRRNVNFYFSPSKKLADSENDRIVNRILLKNSMAMDCDGTDHPFLDSIEMYATMQILNIKQSMFAASFDILLHIAIPASAKNTTMDVNIASFEPNSTFLIESIDIEMSIGGGSSKRALEYVIHKKPIIKWSQYAWQNAQREELITTISNPTCGLSATNSCVNKFVSFHQQFPLRINCKEWQGNYLIAVVLHCHREFARENV